MQQLSFGKHSVVVTWFTLAVCCCSEKNQDKPAQNNLDFAILKADVLHAPKIEEQKALMPGLEALIGDVEELH